jgi:cation diffusion facilitator CzcD-associated flavoprotein CzcO
MPFYAPGRDRLSVVIVGGGYSGLAALIALREFVARIVVDTNCFMS